MQKICFLDIRMTVILPVLMIEPVGAEISSLGQSQGNPAGERGLPTKLKARPRCRESGNRCQLWRWAQTYRVAVPFSIRIMRRWV